jgi:hypothetical protein
MCIKGEDLARAERFQETLNELGEALLKSADRENRLDYLKSLAERQKKAFRRFWWKRGDDVTYYLNKSDYYTTLAKIAEVRKEIEEIDLTVSELEDGVMDCYISPVDDADWPEEPEEPAEAEEADDFPESDDVLAGDEESEEEPVEPEGDASETPKVENDIDDAS